MSKTSVIVVIAAALLIIFMVFRFINIDDQQWFGEGSSPENDEIYTSWVPFTPDTKEFTASFPRPPEHVAESSQPAPNQPLKHFDMYAASGLDNTIYMVQAVTYPQGPSPGKDPEVLKNYLSDLLNSNRSNVLQNSKSVTFNGKPALLFEIKRNETDINGLIFITGNTLYVLSLTKPEDVDTKHEDYNHFINSFKLNNVEKSEKHEDK